MIGIGLAKLRRDGFLSLQAGSAEGFALTRLFSVGTARQLSHTAAAGGGQLEVEVVDENLKPVPGFTRSEFRPVRTDGVSLPGRWEKNADLSALTGRAVRLRFYLRQADLFAFELKPTG